jgi:uncharacterized iron-regulated membrane protein
MTKSVVAHHHRGRRRAWVFRVHLYAGLVAGLWALTMGLSGAALVYAPELEAGPRWARAAARPLPLDELEQIVMRSYSGFRLEDVRFNTAGDATQFHVRREGPAGAAGGDLHLLVDPETGAVLRVVDRRAGVWGFLRDLHHNLLAGRTGRAVNGAGAAALLALCLSGIAIWWPGARRWMEGLSVKRGTSWKRFAWDLHGAAGCWVAGGLALLALTGFHHAFPDAAKGAVRWVSGSPERPKKPRLEARAGERAPLPAVLAKAKAAIPDGRVARINLPKRLDEPFEVRVKTAFDGHDEGNNRLFLDRVTGEPVLVDRFDGLPAAARAIALVGPLHNARFMTLDRSSVGARLPWVAVGLATGVLSVTGLLMWWNRVGSKKWAARRRGRAPLRRARWGELRPSSWRSWRRRWFCGPGKTRLPAV